MKKVNSIAEIGVWVDCPKCNHEFILDSIEY